MEASLNSTLNERGISLPSLYCFSDGLHQAFASLIGNSLDANSRGGCILIRIRTGISWTGNGETGIRVTIADTGEGIHSHMKRHIFEPFVSTKDNTGTGLGLWVTAGMIRKHRGRIAFRSLATPRSSRHRLLAVPALLRRRTKRQTHLGRRPRVTHPSSVP